MAQTHEPWLVRIEDGNGQVHGGGTLLGEEFVLTCAHVVQNAMDDGGSVWVRVRGHAEPRYSAQVVSECWQAQTRGETGDVAVLALDEPVPGAPRARLRRTWNREEPVRVWGFPEGVEHGATAKAAVMDNDLPGERAQLEPRSQIRIQHRFSGAGAIAENGDVLGVVVTALEPSWEASYMVTVATLVKYASPVIDRYLASRASIDPTFSTPQSPAQAAEILGSLVRAELNRQLVAWTESGGPGGVCAVGGGMSVPLVERLVGLSTRQYRDAVGARALGDSLSGPLPSVGAVTAAVDASGKSTGEIARQLAESLSLPADTGAHYAGADLASRLSALGTPVVIVVSSVDAAAVPEELYDVLLEPIAARAPAIGVRLLLAYRADPPRYLRRAIATGFAQQPRGRAPEIRNQASSIDARLTELGKLTEQVAEAEAAAAQEYVRVAPRIAGTPPQRVASAAALRIRLQVLRAASSPQALADPEVRAWFPGELEACETVAADALARARDLTESLRLLMIRREALRDRLRSHRARAVAAGLSEELGEEYGAARRRLFSGLCDLDLAEREVNAYRLAVARRLDGRSSG